MKKVNIKQVRSGIHRTDRQKKTLEALGLGKMNRIVTHTATPQILGMIEKVHHLVEVSDVEE